LTIRYTIFAPVETIMNSTCHEVSDDNEHSVWDEPERHNINQYFGNEECWHPVVSTGILMAEIRREEEGSQWNYVFKTTIPKWSCYLELSN